MFHRAQLPRKNSSMSSDTTLKAGLSDITFDKRKTDILDKDSSSESGIVSPPLPPTPVSPTTQASRPAKSRGFRRIPKQSKEQVAFGLSAGHQFNPVPMPRDHSRASSVKLPMPPATVPAAMGPGPDGQISPMIETYHQALHTLPGGAGASSDSEDVDQSDVGGMDVDQSSTSALTGATLPTPTIGPSSATTAQPAGKEAPLPAPPSGVQARDYHQYLYPSQHQRQKRIHIKR